jgi:hypothetical protein
MKKLIDWKEVTTRFNTKNNTNYAADKAMIKALYKQHKAISRVADLIGVSTMTLCKRMIFLKIPRLPPGGCRNKLTRQMAFKAIPKSKRKKLTADDVIRRLHIDRGYANQLLRLDRAM